MEGLVDKGTHTGGTMMLLLAILAGFLGAMLAPALVRRLGGASGWVLALLPATLTVYFASLLPYATAGTPLAASYPWVPDLGVQLSFRADGLNLLFALLVSGVGTLVVCYAGGYLKGHAQLGRFYAWLLAFMAAMLGVALADDLLLLFVFWELTSVSSYALIGFEHEREEARASALQALLVTGSGGLALLAGLILLGMAGGTTQISALLASRSAIQAHPLYVPALALILIGAFTKSAQFPFHFWLPNAMEAPTPVSAYLHSATMVKAGVYLLARLQPALGGTELWSTVVGGVGAMTMLVGGVLALGQTDLKRLLAYSTVSALGMLTMLIGLGTELSLQAAVVMLLAHALYKGALFLVAGAVDHETGTRDVTQLGGLAHAMPIIAVAAGLAAISMAGMAPFFGFIAKELTYEAALGSGLGVTAVMFCGSVLFVFIAGVVGFGPFWGARRQTPHTPHEAPFSLWFGPLLLAGAGVIIGLAPALLTDALLIPAVSATVGRPRSFHLALWHGITTSLVLSAFTLMAGIGLYLQRHRLRLQVARLPLNRGPSDLYTQALAALNGSASRLTGVVQSGYVRYYLLTIVLTAIGLIGMGLSRGETDVWWLPGNIPGLATLDASFYELGLAGLIVLATLTAITSRSSLSAVAAMGIVGYGVALIYLLFGAPDLAMTQFLVESLTVILFVLAFYHLPDLAVLSSPAARWRDALIALGAGGLMTALVLLSVDIQLHPSISQFFVDMALPLGHGRNIVNVILVDFRALDTLGEITVLGIAAVGVYALLKFPNRKAK
jgi:multicomponent Na+:H+ antiporter subunit A